MLTRTRAIAACAAATASVAAGLAAPAVAAAQWAPAGPAHIIAGGGGPRLTTRVHPAGLTAPINSATFAGYQATVAAGSATVSVATFAVPAVSCTAAALAITPSTGVAVNSYKTFSVAFVVLGCANGTAYAYPGLVVNGTEKDYPASPVAAGDVIDLTTKVSNFRTRVQVTDVTTGVTQKIIGPGARAQAAYTGDDGWVTSPGGLQGVPNFGTLTFGNCLLDSKTLASWHPQAYQRVNSSSVVQIATGALSASGIAFTTQYQNS